MLDERVESGGGNPHDPSMETRVATLEADMKDVKASLKTLELSSIRVEATLASLAASSVTKEGLAGAIGRIDSLTERLHAHGETLADVKTAIRDLAAKVDAKMISGGQMFVIFAGLATLFFTLGGVAIGVLRYLGLLH